MDAITNLRDSRSARRMPPEVSYPETGAMSMIQALNSAMDVMLEKDPGVVIFGEDVGYFGGVFRCTEGLQRKYGEDRVFDTPIAEGGIVATAIGMGVNGLRPVVEIQFADYIYPAFDQIASELARLRYRAIDGESVDAQVQKEAIILEVVETVNADYERALRGDTTDDFDYKWNYDLTSNPEAIRRALEAPREIEPPELEQMKGEGTPVRRRRG